jgi:hypothetical protein
VLLTAESDKPTFGEVVAVGSGKKDEDGKSAAPNVTVGSTVMYSKYSGTEFEVGGIGAAAGGGGIGVGRRRPVRCALGPQLSPLGGGLVRGPRGCAPERGRRRDQNPGALLASVVSASRGALWLGATGPCVAAVVDAPPPLPLLPAGLHRRATTSSLLCGRATSSLSWRKGSPGHVQAVSAWDGGGSRAGWRRALLCPLRGGGAAA